MQLLSCGRAGTVRDKVLVTIQALVEHVQILLRVLSGCNPIKRELLGLGEEGGGRTRDAAKLFESHHGHVPPGY